MRLRLRAIIVVQCACLAIAPQAIGDDGTVLVKDGTFLMGTDQADVAALKSRFQVDWPGVFDNESPAHEVTLSDFRIDKHEVTNAQFVKFLDAVPEWRKDRLDTQEHNGDYLADWQDGQYPEGMGQHPVVFVTWAAAQSYCRWRDGRLPTEAEWEFVARSGDSREFPWGDTLPSPERANYYSSNIGEPVEVGKYPPNDLGVFDLAGNVWELLLDAWVPQYPNEAQIDPIADGPAENEQLRDVRGRRAVRGASFGGSVVNLRTRWRDSHVVTNAIGFVGFRCAYSGSQPAG
jgi:formylglycine-generating enzyme required for sulfatase activity